MDSSNNYHHAYVTYVTRRDISGSQNEHRHPRNHVINTVYKNICYGPCLALVVSCQLIHRCLFLHCCLWEKQKHYCTPILAIRQVATVRIDKPPERWYKFQLSEYGTFDLHHGFIRNAFFTDTVKSNQRFMLIYSSYFFIFFLEENIPHCM